MKQTLLSLASSLQKIGEINSAQLIRILSSYIVVAEDTPKVVITQNKTEELVWPFPNINTLQNIGSFILYALSKHPEDRDDKRRGEVNAAKKELKYLLKDVGPKFYKELREREKEARDKKDTEELKYLSKWLSAMSKIWTVLQNLIKKINNYDKSPGYSKGDNFWSTSK